jgi:hypothetical protein
MKMQSLKVILGTIAAFALGACELVTSTGSTGSGGATSATGATTTSGNPDTSATSTAGSGGAGGAATTTTGTGMCDPKYTCSKAIAQGTGDPALLCEGTTAQTNFDALATCTCSGNCATSCGDNACMQLEPSAACKACLVTADTGCKKEFDACVGS